MKKFLYITGTIVLLTILIVIVIGILNDNKPIQVDTEIINDEAIEEGVSLTEEYSKKIVGEWRSKEDEMSVIIFNEDKTFRDVYNNEGLSLGYWEIKEERGEFDLSFYLYKKIEEEAYEYEILNIDEENLSLIYLSRGNILEYERLKK